MTSIIAEGHGLHREAGPARAGGGEAFITHAHLLPRGDGGRDRSGGQAGAPLHRKSHQLHGDIEIEEMHQHYIKCLRVVQKSLEIQVRIHFLLTTHFSAFFTVIPPRSPLGPIHADIKPNVIGVGEDVVVFVGGELPAVPVGRTTDGQGEAGTQFNGILIFLGFTFFLGVKCLQMRVLIKII